MPYGYPFGGISELVPRVPGKAVGISPWQENDPL
jgi:hypothetical protein